MVERINFKGKEYFIREKGVGRIVDISSDYVEVSCRKRGTIYRLDIDPRNIVNEMRGFEFPPVGATGIVYLCSSGNLLMRIPEQKVSLRPITPEIQKKLHSIS